MNKMIPADLNRLLTCIRQSYDLEPSHIQELTRTYNFLKQKPEQNTEPDTEHALKTALFLAENRFDYKTVLAALLHDCVINQPQDSQPEDPPCPIPKLNKKTVEILQLFRQIHNMLINSSYRHGIAASLKRNFYYTEALFIKIAEMIVLMESSESIDSEEQLSEITHCVKNHLIPEAKTIRAFMLVDKMENLCLKIERHDLYTAIQKKIRETEQLNRPNRDRIFTQFQQIFDKHCRILPQTLAKHDQQYIKEIRWGTRSVSSIARHLEKHTSALPYDLEKLMDKRMMPFIDITLILEDSITDSKLCPKDIFFHYYQEYLKKNCKIYILGCYRTTYKDSEYLLLCDSMDNLYRIFIKTEEEYLCYQLGTSIEKNNFRLEPKNCPVGDSQIKVFKKDGTATIIEDGATVLDLAFRIHESMGLHFSHAFLNNQKRPCPAYTRLANGDTVTIVTSETAAPDYQWFKYVKTDMAMGKLIRYFKNQGEKPAADSPEPGNPV